jgi:hypothetical protein
MGSMKRALRSGCAAAAAVLVLLVGGAGEAADRDRGEPMRVARSAWDLVVLRPLGLVQTLVSLPFLVVAYPISLVTGGSEDVVEICWTQPVDQTFRRPLGDL